MTRPMGIVRVPRSKHRCGPQTPASAPEPHPFTGLLCHCYRGPRVGRRLNHPAHALWGLALLLVGCSAYPREKFELQIPPALGTMPGPDAEFGEVEVLFATDRQPRPERDRPDFGPQRGRRLSYGYGLVSIPREHYRGRLVEHGFGPGDPRRAVVLQSVTVLHDARRGRDAEAFWQRLRERVAHSPRREVAVLVHGFATTFEETIQTAAQVAHDVRFDGVPIVYSWSTQGSVLSYLVDGANAEWTAPYFADFLDQLVRDSGAERIHLCAHSMGARVVVRGIRDYLTRVGWLPFASAEAADGRGQPFSQIILAAGDLDADIFERDYLPSLLVAAERLTLYISRSDRALNLSSHLNGFDRIGQRDLPHTDLQLLQRVDIVDVTDFDRDFFGHLYHSRSPRVLADIQAVLDQGDWRAECGVPDDEADSDTAQKQCRGLQRNFYYRLQPLGQ